MVDIDPSIIVDYLDQVEKMVKLKNGMLYAELLDSLVLGFLGCAFRLIHVVYIIALIQRNLTDHLFCADSLL